MADQDRFLEGQNIYLLSNPNTVNVVLRTDGRKTGPNSVIFVFWIALIVGGGGVMRWSRKLYSGPDEIPSFSSWFFLFKDGRSRVSPRFHLYISDVNEGNDEVGEFKISLGDPKNRKMLGCGIVVIP